MNECFVIVLCIALLPLLDRFSKFLGTPRGWSGWSGGRAGPNRAAPSPSGVLGNLVLRGMIRDTFRYIEKKREREREREKKREREIEKE